MYLTIQSQKYYLNGSELIIKEVIAELGFNIVIWTVIWYFSGKTKNVLIID